jgi:hypothetical protein
MKNLRQLGTCCRVRMHRRDDVMKKSRVILSFFALALAASLTLSCGGSSDPSSEHQLLSITLSPATANVQDYPNGQVQFTATGYYKTAPYTVTPLSAGWGTCFQNAPTTAISVTGTGLARCAAGAAGTYTVWANDPPFSQGINCNAITACGGGCFVAGTAQLSCP